jgi:hypothetical protein
MAQLFGPVPGGLGISVVWTNVHNFHISLDTTEIEFKPDFGSILPWPLQGTIGMNRHNKSLGLSDSSWIIDRIVSSPSSPCRLSAFVCCLRKWLALINFSWWSWSRLHFMNRLNALTLSVSWSKIALFSSLFAYRPAERVIIVCKELDTSWTQENSTNSALIPGRHFQVHACFYSFVTKVGFVYVLFGRIGNKRMPPGVYWEMATVGLHAFFPWSAARKTSWTYYLMRPGQISVLSIRTRKHLVAGATCFTHQVDKPILLPR